MTIGTLFYIAVIVACPAGMMFMMRGGHSMGKGSHPMGGGEDPNAAAREQHIADLERENAQLRGAAHRADVPEPIGRS